MACITRTNKRSSGADRGMRCGAIHRIHAAQTDRSKLVEHQLTDADGGDDENVQ